MTQNKRINALQFQRADAEIYQYRTISIRRWINQSRGSNLIDVLVNILLISLWKHRLSLTESFLKESFCYLLVHV